MRVKVPAPKVGSSRARQGRQEEGGGGGGGWLAQGNQHHQAPSVVGVTAVKRLSTLNCFTLDAEFALLCVCVSS